MTHVGRSVVLEGDLSGDEDLTIEGRVKGRIDLPGHQLTVGANGHIEAEVHAKAVQYCASGDLPILMGTDPVLPGMHGRNYMELHHLIQDGLSPLATWYGATGLAAREIGQDDTGTFEPGKRADLVIAKGDIIERPALLDDKGGDGDGLVEVVQDGHGHRGLEGFPQRDFRSTL